MASCRSPTPTTKSHMSAVASAPEPRPTWRPTAAPRGGRRRPCRGCGRGGAAAWRRRCPGPRRRCGTRRARCSGACRRCCRPRGLGLLAAAGGSRAFCSGEQNVGRVGPKDVAFVDEVVGAHRGVASCFTDVHPGSEPGEERIVVDRFRERRPGRRPTRSSGRGSGPDAFFVLGGGAGAVIEHRIQEAFGLTRSGAGCDDRRFGFAVEVERRSNAVA